MSQDQASLRVPDGGVKMLRESLCAAQAALALTEDRRALHHHRARLQDLIDQCDRHRPLGWDGKHGDRHTATCGCEDVDEPGQGVDVPDEMEQALRDLGIAEAMISPFLGPLSAGTRTERATMATARATLAIAHLQLHAIRGDRALDKRALLHAMADEIERLAGGADRLPVAGVLATIRTYAEAQR